MAGKATINVTNGISRIIGGICGPLISSAILLRTGSYTPVFVYLAVFCALAAVFVMFARHKNAAAEAEN